MLAGSRSQQKQHQQRFWQLAGWTDPPKQQLQERQMELTCGLLHRDHREQTHPNRYAAG
jgi:hypothetical protein